jgi:large subunit ribosomal protein L19
MGKYIKSDKVAKDQQIEVGDLVRIHQKIYEDDKTRIQIFEGTVLAIKNRQENAMLMVRKMSEDKVAVERIYPLNSPHIDKIEVKKKGNFRKSKLYYLRNSN